MVWSKLVKSFMSILKWQANSSSDYASFFIAMTHISSVNFKLINFLLWTKELHQSPYFDALECSGKNFPSYSFPFLNHKYVFLQILHYSSVSWKITPLHFLAQTLYTLFSKNPFKAKIFEIFEYSGQNSSNFICHF